MNVSNECSIRRVLLLDYDHVVKMHVMKHHVESNDDVDWDLMYVCTMDRDNYRDNYTISYQQ